MSVDWKALKKIDAHIHILPNAVHRANSGSGDVWNQADVHKYLCALKKCGPFSAFASDYPDNRRLPPEAIYGAHFDILGQMDFTQTEAEQIARGNLLRLLPACTGEGGKHAV